MLDDDTGKEVRCRYCSSADDCEHLLAVADRTISYFPAGFAADRIPEFGEIIEKVFLRTLNDEPRSPGTWNDRHVSELWNYASGAWTVEGIVSLDKDILFSLVIELLEAAGGKRYAGPVHDGEAPGFSSAITLLYAEYPRYVFDRALSDLKTRLTLTSG